MSSSKQDEVCFRVSAPGKIILHGEHSVVYGSTALAASISRCTNVVWRVHGSGCNTLKLSLSLVGVEREYSVSDVQRTLLAALPPLVQHSKQASFSVETPELLDLPELLPVLNKFIPDAPSLTRERRNALLAFFTLLVGMLSSVNVVLKPCSVSVSSDLRVGAGLGSSASYSVALAAALWQLIRASVDGRDNIARDGYKPVCLARDPSAELSHAERDLISRWAYQCERIMHGNPSGIDNLVCAHGSIIQFKKNMDGPGITWNKLPPVEHLNILLVDTKVSRNTSVLIEKVVQLKAKLPSVVEAVFLVMDKVALHAASVFEKMSSADADHLDQHLSILEELIDVNQCQLACLGVSHPRLDRICDAASQHGMHAKLTGAGGGGNAFVLVRPSQDDASHLQQQLESEGFHCIATAIGHQGVTISNIVL